MNPHCLRSILLLILTWDRSQYFYYLYSTYLVCELLAPAIASVTITTNVFIPFGIGLSLIAITIPILLVIPETHKNVKTPTVPKRRNSSTDLPYKDVSQDSGLLKRAMCSGWKNLRSLSLAFCQRNLPLAFVVLFIGSLRPATLSVLLQYAVVRFNWPISNTAMLVSEVALVNIILFLFVLPQAILFITSVWHIRGQIIDRSIVFWSLLILSLGVCLIGLAPSSKALLPGE